MLKTKRYNLNNGIETYTANRKNKIDINELVESYGVNVVKFKSSFFYKDKIYKIIQITNDTKTPQNRDLNEIEKRRMIAKWDTLKTVESKFDFVIIVYNSGDKFLNFIIDSKNYLAQDRREINHFISLDELKVLYSFEGKKEVALLSSRGSKNECIFTFFQSDKFADVA